MRDLTTALQQSTEIDFDTELIQNQVDSAIEDNLKWIGFVENPSDGRIADLNFNWLYAHYRQLEGIVRLYTDQLSDDQWDQIEKIRLKCELLRKLYGPHFKPVDLEP